jgi:hypothetical protein
MPSYATITPGVFAYSYEWKEPINLTDYVVGVTGSLSIVGSTQDRISITMKGAIDSELLSLMDWIQLTFYSEASNPPAHIFFGRISSISHGSAPMSATGIMTTTTITAVTWAAFMLSTATEHRRWLPLYLRGQYKDAPTVSTWSHAEGLSIGTDDSIVKLEDVPTLATLMVALDEKLRDGGRQGLIPDPMTAVQLWAEMWIRFGGPLRQEFEMPVSFADGKSYPLHNFVAKVNRTKLKGDQTRKGIPLDTAKDGKGEQDTEFDRKMNLSRPFAESWYKEEDDDRTRKKSAWVEFFDWGSYWRDCEYYTPGRCMMKDAIRWGHEKPLWGGMHDYSDPGFTELFCSLIEHAEIPKSGLSGEAEAHDGLMFDRDFLPTIVFRPMPHPTYPLDREVKPIENDFGTSITEADATGYKLCNKLMLDVNSLVGLNMNQNGTDLRTSWVVKPEAALLGDKGAAFEDGFITAATGYKIPLYDEKAMDVYGWLPQESQTKYWMLPPDPDLALRPDEMRPKEAFDVLVLKTYLQHAWTIRALDTYQGEIRFKAFNHDIPRPGDVGFLVGQPLTPGRLVIPGNEFPLIQADESAPNVGTQAQTRAAVHSMASVLNGDNNYAFSFYVEGVGFSVTTSEESATHETVVTVSFSHGQLITLGSEETDANGQRKTKDILKGKPYKRFVDYSEVGIDPKWWLPYTFDITAELKRIVQRRNTESREAMLSDQLTSEIGDAVKKISDDKKPQKKRGRTRGQILGLKPQPYFSRTKAADSLAAAFDKVKGKPKKKRAKIPKSVKRVLDKKMVRAQKKKRRLRKKFMDALRSRQRKNDKQRQKYQEQQRKQGEIDQKRVDQALGREPVKGKRTPVDASIDRVFGP